MGSILFLLYSCHFAVININFYIPQRICRSGDWKLQGVPSGGRGGWKGEAGPIGGRIRACRKQSTAQCLMGIIPSWAPRTPFTASSGPTGLVLQLSLLTAPEGDGPAAQEPWQHSHSGAPGRNVWPLATPGVGRSWL